MDYDKQYKVARDDGQGTQSTGNTLYEACVAAKAHGPNGIVLSHEGRLVAFYCGHRNRIAPGFGAQPLERDQIITDFGYEAL
jgi:hypothetical protein